MSTLRMTQEQHDRIRSHLHDGTGLEAVCVGICGRGGTAARPVFTVHQVTEIPYAECDRAVHAVRWPTRRLRDLLEVAARQGMAAIRIHSHPEGATAFSALDDASDAELFDAIALKVPGEHVSAVMLPDGEVFARVLAEGRVVRAIEKIAVVGDDLVFSNATGRDGRTADFELRHRQAFGERTTRILSMLAVAVVGVSGTGSPTVEMLARLGVQRIVLIEFDVVEEKNLNRIWGVRRLHAEARTNKAQAIAAHIRSLGLGTEVEVIADRIDAPEAIAAVASCDLVFGCMDSVEGRDVLNRIATFHTLPYIDVGVRLDADGEGGIASMSAGIHYLCPGRSSLRTRGVYTPDELRAEHLRRTDPAFYDDQVRRGYIKGVDVERPAVISINTATAAMAVNEMLARLHSHRTRPNADFAIQKLLFTHGRTTTRGEPAADLELAPYVGRGRCDPPLMLPRIRAAA